MCRDIGTVVSLLLRACLRSLCCAAQNIPYPLSVKCRLHESVDYTISLLRRLDAVGVKAFTVHVTISRRLVLLPRRSPCLSSPHCSSSLLQDAVVFLYVRSWVLWTLAVSLKV